MGSKFLVLDPIDFQCTNDFYCTSQDLKFEVKRGWVNDKPALALCNVFETNVYILGIVMSYDLFLSITIVNGNGNKMLFGKNAIL